ncbi:hypothetical protein KMW28_26870 [Flammeovirga yaeyamensis]|uniref:Uncharacterized protein n=1 Tax=Flammeovirga yaeyamensis TaxID=367791 RepID=A0AAX1NEY5_9BACT|nr:hypothetical protein [Flammeovirga yaeyamensis]MBB3701536.1 hypothetical protein [Flammeovirga yaeyamensis]NMF38681.1 hypothetical protein [Flammeovirga yaeyamensis]QWG04523.1 hypothetical protein KMW28_26870 [Flammeovirga yaeyamensis]
MNFSLGNNYDREIGSIVLKNNNFNTITIGDEDYLIFSVNEQNIKFTLTGVEHQNEGEVGDLKYIEYDYNTSKIYFNGNELILTKDNYNSVNKPTEITIPKSKFTSKISDETINSIDLEITYDEITYEWDLILGEYRTTTKQLNYTLTDEKKIDVFFDFTQPIVSLSDMKVAKSATEVIISVNIDDPTIDMGQEHELVFSNSSVGIFSLPQIGDLEFDSDNNHYTLTFGAPNSDGSFFRGYKNLDMYIEHTDLAGNLGYAQVPDGQSQRNPIITLTENDFYIASVHHQKTNNYLKQGSQLKYKFAFEDGVDGQEQVIHENFSEIVLFNEANEVKKVLYPTDSEVNINTDNNRIILTLDTDILNLFNEGEVIKSFVNLYNTSDPRLNATWTDYHVIDNTKPSLPANPALLVSNTEVLSPEWSTEDLTWLQSDSEAIVTLNLNEFDLNKNETSLKVKRVIVDGSNTNEQELSIALDNFTKDNSNLNQLTFKFNPNEGLSNPNKYPTYFTIVGIEAKDIANNSSGRLDLSSSSENYYFSSFDPSITIESIEYKQNEIPVDLNGELKNGDVTITAPYIASSLKDNIQIRVLGVDESDGNVSTTVVSVSDNILTFKITIDDTKFQSGSRLNYDLIIEDGSGNIVEEKNILGPEIRFDIPANFNVAYPHNPFSKWLVQIPGPTDNLIVEVLSNEENFRANVLEVYENDEYGTLLFRYEDENLNNTDKVYIEIPYSAITDNISNPYLGELVLAYRTYNTSDQSINVPKRSIYLSDVADVELENDWYLFGYSAKNFGLNTNIDDNAKVNVFEYWPTTEIDNIISPINMWRDGDFTNDNDTRTVDLRVKAYDENSGISEDTVRFEVTQKSILDSQFKDFYCSNSQETNEFSINTIFVDADSNGTTLGLNLYRLENGDSVLVEVDEALVKINGEDSNLR